MDARQQNVMMISFGAMKIWIFFFWSWELRKYPGYHQISFLADDGKSPKATYVCVNNGESFSPREIERQSICINDDIGAVLKQVRYEVSSQQSRDIEIAMISMEKAAASFERYFSVTKNIGEGEMYWVKGLKSNNAGHVFFQ